MAPDEVLVTSSLVPGLALFMPTLPLLSITLLTEPPVINESILSAPPEVRPVSVSVVKE